jgi:hypothetical protein
MPRCTGANFLHNWSVPPKEVFEYIRGSVPGSFSLRQTLARDFLLVAIFALYVARRSGSGKTRGRRDPFARRDPLRSKNAVLERMVGQSNSPPGPSAVHDFGQTDDGWYFEAGKK